VQVGGGADRVPVEVEQQLKEIAHARRAVDCDDTFNLPGRSSDLARVAVSVTLGRRDRAFRLRTASMRKGIDRRVRVIE
jgi:hypothetical protein